MEFIDFKKRSRSSNIEMLLPGWESGENVAFLSPHDDDVVLGSAYLLSAVIKNGGKPHLFIFCKGDAGYSTVAEKTGLVGRRKGEAIECYRTLGVQEEDISFMDVPDFSLMSYVSRRLPYGEGLFDDLLRALRAKRISRIVFSNGNFEHWDHTAVFEMGMYTAAQAGDHILVDLGEPFQIRSHLIYSVWGDFERDPADPDGIDADKGILVDDATEQCVRRAIASFSSQQKVIGSIVAHREQRKSEEGYLELYRIADVRRQIDYRRYIGQLAGCRRMQ